MRWLQYDLLRCAIGFVVLLNLMVSVQKGTVTEFELHLLHIIGFVSFLWAVVSTSVFRFLNSREAYSVSVPHL